MLQRKSDTNLADKLPVVCVWKKWTYRVTVVQGVTEFLQGVQELDVVPSLVGKVRDSPVVLLPLLQQINFPSKLNEKSVNFEV